MKIGGMTPKHITAKKTVSKGEAKELPREQVSIGNKSDDLGIMDRPLLSTKSCGTGDIGSAIMKGIGIAGGAGALAAGAGIAGNALGGGAGIAIAAGASALIGGAVMGKFMSSGRGNINTKGFLAGAATMGIMSAAGAGLSTVGPAWVGGPLAVAVGAVGGAGAGIGGLMLFNNSHRY